MQDPISALILVVLNIYWWIVLAAVVASWLVVLNVINVHNNFARSVLHGLAAVTEPVFRPIRRILPPMGGFDLSPLVVLVIIWFLEYLVTWIDYRFVI